MKTRFANYPGRTIFGYLLAKLEGHTFGVEGVAFSPDGRILASASRDRSVRLWDVDSGREVAKFEGHTDDVSGVAFSPDGQSLASASNDNSVRLWDVDSGREVAKLEGHTAAVSGVAFSPDGRILASASGDNSVRLWDADSGREITKLTRHTDYVKSVLFSPDGRILASASGDRSVRLWDVESSREIAKLEGHSNYVWGVAFSPDGRNLASASGDRSVRLWDVDSGREVAKLEGHTDCVLGVAFSPDGRILASASGDNSVRLWDVESSREIAKLEGHFFTVWGVAFSPDGRSLASASGDNSIRLWNADSGREVAKIEGHTGFVETVAFAPDGRSLASGSGDRSVRLWDADSGREVAKLEGHLDYVWDVAFSPDGRSLASGSIDKSVRLWDVDSGREVAKLEGHTDGVRGVAFSPDGRILASASGDKTVRLWDVDSGREVAKLEGHTNVVWGIAFSPDGRILASASGDKSVRLWDVESNREVAKLVGHTDGVRGVAFSPDDRILASASEDRSVRLWDVDSGREVAKLEGHTNVVWGIAFSPDGRILASGSIDKSARLWDVDSGREAATLVGHTSEITSLTFNPDGRILASASNDGSVILWAPDEPPVSFRTISTTTVTRDYRNAKVVLVGDSGRGKSCLARALVGFDFEPQESTHGMKVWNFQSKTISDLSGIHERDILLWDLAGQSDYRLIHQLFLDQTALTILLFDPSDAENPFAGVKYWLNSIRKVVDDNKPRLLVAGRVDRGHATVSEKEIESFLKNHGFTRYLPTSAKTGSGIDELKVAISEAIVWEDLPYTSSPQLWQEMRAYLLERRKGTEILSRKGDLLEAFRRGRPDARFKTEEFDTVIGHAQTQGLLWRLSFGDFVLLKPELLNNYASAIVRAARKHSEGLGSLGRQEILRATLDFEDMERIDDKITEISLLHAVLELCLEREIALPEGDQIVFPSKFNRALPDYPNPPRREIAYHFAGPLEEIYARLIVRLFYSDAFKLKDLYKNAAEFCNLVDAVCGFIMEVIDEGQALLSIFFDEQSSVETKLLFVRFVHEHLNTYALPKSLERERIYRCPECGEEVENKRAVKIRLSKGHNTIRCQYCDEPVPLIDPLEERFGDAALLKQVREARISAEQKKGNEVGITQANAKQEIGEFDVFLCHNSEDKPDVRKLAERLRQLGLNPWLDEEQLRPGLRWQRALERQIENIKSATVIIGPSGTGPWQRMELEAFLLEFVRREVPVIPLVLKTAPEQPELPVFLRGIMWVDFRKNEPNPEDQLVFGITGKRPERRRI